MAPENRLLCARLLYFAWVRKRHTQRGKTSAVGYSETNFLPEYRGRLASTEIMTRSPEGGYPSPKPVIGEVKLSVDEDYFPEVVSADYSGERVNRTIWGSGSGWFSASFGPFRRFTGGDRMYDRLFVSNRRLAPHLTALGEDVALTEALSWLTSLHIQSLQDEKNKSPSRSQEIMDHVKNFVNFNGFLPHGAEIFEVTNEYVLVKDGNNNLITLESLSDGYRSALSLVFELIRQMFELYGTDVVLNKLRQDKNVIKLPGVVAIDEVDAHLHPTWQHQIGRWLTTVFPMVQFIVTTHSPIICRAVANDEGRVTGSVWKLPIPGTTSQFHRVRGVDLDQLVFGDVLDAYSTELFGAHITRSGAGGKLIERLAELNSKGLRESLTAEERDERRHLRRMFPAEVARTID